MAFGYVRLAAHHAARLNHALWAVLIGLVLIVFAATAASAAKPFPINSFTYYMNDYDAELKKLAKTIDKPAAELEIELAAAEAASNARLAAVSLEKLLALAPTDAALWLKLAQRLAVSQPINDEDGYRLPYKAVGASLKAYLLAA
ncbi:MAG: hypothetical protein H7X89_08695, partial [Rhizobiales bacterium]|nr:hypothetical protein [Hyphomicrobiales bacterium]